MVPQGQERAFMAHVVGQRWQAGFKMTSEVLTRFSPATRDWFSGSFAEPTTAQIGAWDAISSGAPRPALARRCQRFCGLWTDWPPLTRRPNRCADAASFTSHP